jgi:hypothetical protein
MNRVVNKLDEERAPFLLAAAHSVLCRMEW